MPRVVIHKGQARPPRHVRALGAIPCRPVHSTGHARGVTSVKPSRGAGRAQISATQPPHR